MGFQSSGGQRERRVTGQAGGQKVGGEGCGVGWGGGLVSQEKPHKLEGVENTVCWTRLLCFLLQKPQPETDGISGVASVEGRGGAGLMFFLKKYKAFALSQYSYLMRAFARSGGEVYEGMRANIDKSGSRLPGL